MRLSKRSSVLVFGLLLGGICSPAAKASADELPSEGTTLEVQAPSQHVTVAYLTAVSFDVADADLPDDPGSGVQQQTASGEPPPEGSGSTLGTRALSTHSPREDKPSAFFTSIPNFRAVSADQHLPPQSVKEKFKTAMLDSVDYSSFIFVAGQAGVAQANNSYPEFGQGAKGYGRYYWHTLADAINENTWVEFIVPQRCIRTRGITPWAAEMLASGWGTHSRASWSRVRMRATKPLITARFWEPAHSPA